MNIGIDIDGVILDSEKEFKIMAELYDTIYLKRNSIINEKEVKFQDKYNWSEEEKVLFINKYFLKVSEECNFMPGAIQTIDLLKKEGHKLIIITARGGMIKEMKDVVEKRFLENNLKFDKYYWTIENKLEICKKENIDIMIDDNYKICKVISDARINTLYFREYPNYELKENKYLKEVYNWGEVYRNIKYLEENNAR